MRHEKYGEYNRLDLALLGSKNKWETFFKPNIDWYWETQEEKMTKDVDNYEKGVNGSESLMKEKSLSKDILIREHHP